MTEIILAVCMGFVSGYMVCSTIRNIDKKDKKIRTPITHTNRKNAYMHKTGVNGNVLFKSRLYLWL